MIEMLKRKFLLYSKKVRISKDYSVFYYLFENQIDIDDMLNKAQEVCCQGKPILINPLIGKTDFRKGSISV